MCNEVYASRQFLLDAIFIYNTYRCDAFCEYAPRYPRRVPLLNAVGWRVRALAMTEQEMCLVLGILNEPEKNRVRMDEHLRLDLALLGDVFAIARDQREHLGSVNCDVWIDFLPWHSMN